MECAVQWPHVSERLGSKASTSGSSDSNSSLMGSEFHPNESSVGTIGTRRGRRSRPVDAEPISPISEDEVQAKTKKKGVKATRKTCEIGSIIAKPITKFKTKDEKATRHPTGRSGTMSDRSSTRSIIAKRKPKTNTEGLKATQTEARGIAPEGAWPPLTDDTAYAGI